MSASEWLKRYQKRCHEICLILYMYSNDLFTDPVDISERFPIVSYEEFMDFM